jgi:hypothetical protein
MTCWDAILFLLLTGLRVVHCALSQSEQVRTVTIIRGCSGAQVCLRPVTYSSCFLLWLDHDQVQCGDTRLVTSPVPIFTVLSSLTVGTASTR